MRYSIITCAYNAAKHIPAFFEIMNKIDYSDFELVIVDDASSDETYDLILNFSRCLDRKVTVIRQQKNTGPGAARNAALNQADGEKFIFIDVDDEIDGRVFQFLDECLEYDVVFFDYYKKYSSAKKIKCSSLLVPGGEVHDIDDLLSTTTGSVWGKMFDAELIRKHSISFPDLYKSEDFVFMISYLSHCRSAFYLRHPLYVYSVSSASLMHQNVENQVPFAYKAIELIRQLPISEEVKELFYYREIIYDLTNVYISTGKSKSFLMGFWRENPLPSGWRRVRGKVRKGQFCFLWLISHHSFYILRILLKFKKFL